MPTPTMNNSDLKTLNQGSDNGGMETNKPAFRQPAQVSGSDSTLSGMTVGSQVPAPTATPVDSKTVEGCYAGDHRSPSKDTAAASLASAADNGGPRNPVGQYDAPPSVTSKLHGAGSAESEC